jgi:hypothetical protein
MVRTQCQVLHSQGAVTARHALTIRSSPAEGRAQELLRQLAEVARGVTQQPGIVGLHVLRHEAPAMTATTEQKIRGNADQAADWVIVVSGYALDALRSLGAETLSESSLRAWGAIPETAGQYFTLACSAVSTDMR